MQKQLKLLFVVTLVIAVGSLLGLSDAVAGKCCKMTGSAEARHLNFSHGKHVTENGAACADCHHAATGSKSGEDDLLPSHAECAKCHAVDDKNECASCHVDANPVNSPRVTGYSAKFSHEMHTGKGELDCAACHKDLDGALPSTAAGHFPAMSECMKCHNEKLVANEC